MQAEAFTNNGYEMDSSMMDGRKSFLKKNQDGPFLQSSCGNNELYYVNDDSDMDDSYRGRSSRRRNFVSKWNDKFDGKRLGISENGGNDVQNRRSVMNQINILSANLFGLAFAGKAHAACLSGDTSKECIGVYKVPVDEEILPFVDTPENLLRFAPDVKWVPPVEPCTDPEEARRMIQVDFKKISGLNDLILKGDLTAAGSIILDAMARLQVAGKCIDNEAITGKAIANGVDYLRWEAAFEDAKIGLGQLDVALGQGIRGEIGSITVTQLALLSEVKQAVEKYTVLVSVFAK